MDNKRTFERTHPWIKFEIDLRQFSTTLWLRLGEAQSKCEHLAGVPLRPDTAKRLHSLYLAKGVLATTAIEGNTLSEEDVVKHLEGTLQLPASKQYLAKEVDNIIKVCNSLLANVAKGTPLKLTPERIAELNRLILDGLQVPTDVVPGKIRKNVVGVARYRVAPPEDCEFLLERLCKWMEDPTFEEVPGSPLISAILRAILAHIYLAWIHPFGDGNGRTARLVEFQLLIGAGVPAPAAHLLSNHYNLTRTEYYRQLEQASASGGKVIPFITYALEGFIDGLLAQIEVVRDQQINVAWENYVHEMFRDRSSLSNSRRRRFILDLSNKGEWVRKSELSKISPEVAKLYATKGPKTLPRDLNALSNMGLLERRGNTYRAKKEIILAFLPVRRKPMDKLILEPN
jgi:Fic family protein